ncbi:hypothetical protein BV898_03266 [Hypsibius exemplaris]|uniref:Uncharacterized protein n=1 Tax=Hypsibius exemplaris TaxID=2072580 RepID=A0A1W0X5S2_HYPEX|nr:hypothetical protein BV898_03266 [Hypsibius exemplaris]
MQWIYYYNIVLGVVNLIDGIIHVSRSGEIQSTLAGMAITLGFLLISAAFCLLFAVYQERSKLLLVWFVCFGAYAVLNIVSIVYIGYLYSHHSLDVYYTFGVVGFENVSLLLQVAALVTVLKYKKLTNDNRIL